LKTESVLKEREEALLARPESAKKGKICFQDYNLTAAFSENYFSKAFFQKFQQNYQSSDITTLEAIF
jgi:hypothetical protein